ncbi:uncharacterized protein A1O9_03592 [Exophiala aquamarina CBS 119918]|uniref:Major facilitator superfamily (MFS) profile domain-containing protein n=1 Tax=Exophiala aquamarina CBS 119918 TaxID=1182545 RepID=A0A072Q298_9EURO|nr:uncharacterized protein A1O9_03592 [Exophiala aquamarina CBS 119918]KEF62020.1 hypothetical protein A1O9_03592 [Exophiala aquamarina CBS 119918]
MEDDKHHDVEEHSIAPPVEQESPEAHVHAKTYLVIFAMFIVNLTSVTCLVTAGAFGQVLTAVVGGTDKSNWIVGAISLPMAVLSAPVAQAADYWGRRWLLIVLTSMGFVGSLITSRCESIGVAILGQSFIGLSFSCISLTFAIVSEVLPHRQRMTGQAVVNSASALGGIVGIYAAASLVTNHGPSGFRILWYLDAALYAVAVVITLFCYRPPPRELQKSLTSRQKLEKLDWIGGLLLTAGLILFCLGLSQARNPYTWDSAQVLAPICVSVPLLGAFALYEWKGTVEGIANYQLFSCGRNFGLALACIFLEGFIFTVRSLLRESIAFRKAKLVSLVQPTNIYLPFMLESVYGRTPLLMATNVTVLQIVYGVASFAAALYCYRYRRLRIVIVAAYLFLTAYNAGMAALDEDDSNAAWGVPILAGVPIGLALCALVAVAQFSTPPDLISVTSGLLVAARAVGVTTGTAAFGATFSSKLQSNLAPKVAEATLPLGLPLTSLPLLLQALAAHDEEALMGVPGVTPAILAAGVKGMKQGYIVAFRTVWIVAAAVAAGGLVLSFFFQDRKEDFNNRIDAPAESEDALYGEALHKGTTA